MTAAAGSYRAPSDTPVPENEREILARLAAGDDTAFEAIFSRHARLVISTALRLTRNRADAEDVAQEVFLRVFRKIRTYDPSRPFLPWLYQITLNETYSRMRRRRRRREAFAANASLPGEGAVSFDVEEGLAARELARRAEEIIGGLSPRLGTVLWMHDVAGVSTATLSRLLRLPVPTIKSRLHQGRLVVRESLLGIRTDLSRGRALRSPAAGGGRVTGHEMVESLLLDYFEGRLEGEDRARFEEHMRGCAVCGPVVETYAQTVRRLQSPPELDIPPEMLQATFTFLRESLEKGRHLHRDWTAGLAAAFGRGRRRRSDRAEHRTEEGPGRPPAGA